MAKSTKKKSSTSEAKETNLVRRVTLKPANKNIQSFSTGDTVNVHVKVKEGEKERIQVYKGIVTRLQGSGASRSFTVRKISAGVGVERIFPFSSPAVEKVELLATGKIRRSKLYYLRALDGKAAKIESELAVQKTTTEAAAQAE
ncbi:MAG: 50S ribosomal protein L19 [Bdellovibrionaceae bacterium]|nr:50S ribosomal protein L19 [Pseudobdellovibrionaceae bacterium]